MSKNKQDASRNYCRGSLGWSGVGVFAFGLAVIYVLLSSGCPKTTQTRVPSYEEARQQVLKKGDLVQDPLEQREKLQGCDDKPTVLKKDAAGGIPYTGLLITNQKAACLVAIKTERDRLRKELQAERLESRANTIIHTAAQQKLAEQAKRSWWEQHRLSILTPVLITIGGAIVIAVMYCLTGGNSINVSTNAAVMPR